MHYHASSMSMIKNIYVLGMINHQNTNLMIDSGATQNFITPSYSTKLELRLEIVKGKVLVNFVRGSDAKT